MKKTIFTLSLSLGLGLGMMLLVFVFIGRPAAAAPDALTPIYDIQYTTTPGGDGTYPSPLVGQAVTTTGIVYAVYGNGFFIADASGPWHGIYVYYPSGVKPQVGDLVQVEGQVQEYYGLTELGNYASYTVLSSGNSIHAPSVVTASAIQFDDSAVSEQYESVFVEVHNITVTAEVDTYGIWTFTDSSGGAAKADDWGYHLEPNVGDQFVILRGALPYDWNEFKVMPRDADDVIQGPHLALDKDAPINVAPGARFTYTLTILNNTGISLTQVIITDAVPITNATLAEILDGGVLLPGDIISWTASSLPSGGSLSVRFAVTAAGGLEDEIWNIAYAVWAGNWPTPTVGAPLLTFIGDYLPIYRIQGDGSRSPYTGLPVRTVGVVIGFFEGNLPSGGGVFDGFYIQDPDGDGDDATSDGLFVNHGTLNVSVSVGDLVTVTGEVQEFSERDGAACAGDECLTQISVGASGDVLIAGADTVTPTLLDPPGDPDQAAVYWESLEGMLTTLPFTGAVVGPTSYGTIMAIPGDEGVERVMRGSPQEGMPFGVRHWKRYGDLDDGSDPPNLIVGSIVDNVDGPLAFSYSNYIVATQFGDAWNAVYSQPEPAPVPEWPAPAGGQFSAATLNTYNFDTGSSPSYGVKRTKVVSTVGRLGGPTFLAMQEIDVAGVITDLLTDLGAAGYHYDYAYSHPDVGGHGVALLWRTDRVTDAVWSTAYQSCSAHGSSSSTYDPLWDDCRALDQYPLFSRRPVVITATVTTDAGPVRVVVIGNHFKSKRGSSTCDDAECSDRRTAQAAFVAGLVDQFVADGLVNALVMGDLNDFLDSPPLQALQASGNLTDTFYLLPPEARYSYIYRGVSQVLDHALVSPNLLPAVAAASPLHYNADFPYNPYSGDGGVVWRTSDHDPVAATFDAAAALTVTKEVTPAADVEPGGIVTYTLILHNSGIADALGVALTDDLPAGVSFGGWVMQNGAVVTGNAVAWTGDLPGGDRVTVAFTAVVTDDSAYLGSAMTNTARYTSTNGGGGSSQATFWVRDVYSVYLPLVAKNH